MRTVDRTSRVGYFSRWIIDRGDEFLFFNYPLNSKSIVIDIGGYKGFFSDEIISLYDPTIYILEPVQEYFLILKNKYAKNKKVKIFNFGLSDKNITRDIYLSGDGSSLIKKGNKSEKIKLVDTAIFFKKIGLVDLVSINIEGSEYEVLDKLISTSLINNIKYLQVQFHEFIPNSIKMRNSIVKLILKTHKIKYSYPFVWESFELKKKQ